MHPVLVFDIETIPDVPGLRRLHDLDPALRRLDRAAGGPFLPDVFGAASRQVVRLAFGANLADSPTAWNIMRATVTQLHPARTPDRTMTPASPKPAASP